MPVKDFFRLVIKLFGLYSLIVAFFQSLPYASTMVAMNTNAEYWLIIIALFVLLILLFLLLIYSTDGIVDKLDLARGFSQPQIEFGKLDDKTMIKLGCILIGGFLIVNNIAFFVTNAYLLFRQENIDEPENKEHIRFVVSALNLLIGYLLITNYDRVSKLLALKKSEE